MVESGMWPKDQHEQKRKHVFKFKIDDIVLERGNSALTSHTDESTLPLQRWQRLTSAQGNGKVFSCAGTNR